MAKLAKTISMIDGVATSIKERFAIFDIIKI